MDFTVLQAGDSIHDRFVISTKYFGRPTVPFGQIIPSPARL